MRKIASITGLMGFLLAAGVSQAALDISYQFTGQGNWSLNAVGSNNEPIGNLQAAVPPGSTVIKAFLYSSRTLNAPTFPPVIVLDGQTNGPDGWTDLGDNAGLHAWRADVTAQVSTKIGSGSPTNILFSVDFEGDFDGEEVNDINLETDGEALAIVYSNATEQVRTITFYDGFAAVTGDSVTYNFGAPLAIGPGFQALMSVGIGFSYQPPVVQPGIRPQGEVTPPTIGGSTTNLQYTILDINGRQLTAAAGGGDNGDDSGDGSLITIGGIGDVANNPPDPYALPVNERSDEELYNLAQGDASNSTPFLVNGLTNMTITTFNPSGDDNLFFLGLNITESTVSNQCATAADLISKIEGLGLTRSLTQRLERQAKIIGVSQQRHYNYGRRHECEVLDKLLGALVRLGRLDSAAAQNVADCCEMVTGSN